MIVIQANIGWDNDDDRLSYPKRDDLVEVEATPSKEISGGAVVGACCSTTRSIVDGDVNSIRQCCTVDDIVLCVSWPRRCLFSFSPRQGVCEDGALERRRGLDDDRDTNVARRVQCRGVVVVALEAAGRAAEIVGARSLLLPLERAWYELSKDDDRDRPSRVTAERRALGLLASGV